MLIDELYGSCESVVDILNALLLYQGLDQGEISLITKSIPVIPFLQMKIIKLMSQARSKGVNLSLNIPENRISGNHIKSACIEGDEDKFGQVIRTLIANAVDCTMRGGSVTVTVTVIGDDEIGYKLKMAVRDDGPGLTDSDQRNMFDNALSFTPGVLQQREGNGLGLW
eukprot:gene6719-13613_t